MPVISADDVAPPGHTVATVALRGGHVVALWNAALI
jgi:hypothetical protein